MTKEAVKKMGEGVSKHINTILLSVITIMLGYGVTKIQSLADSQSTMQVQIAVILSETNNYKNKIDQNEFKINENSIDIEELKLRAASSDRISRTDALAAVEHLKQYVENNFEKK